MKGAGQACHVDCHERDERNAEVKVEGLKSRLARPADGGTTKVPIILDGRDDHVGGGHVLVGAAPGVLRGREAARHPRYVTGQITRNDRRAARHLGADPNVVRTRVLADVGKPT